MVRLPVCWMEGLQGMEFDQIELFIDLYTADPACEDNKVCSKCVRLLPRSSFSFQGRGSYPRSECKSCTNEMTRIRKGLKDIHGQPPAGYECPICLADEEKAAGRGGNSSTWVLDHNHDTDEFRGWLCHSCNRALGCFNDDVPRMQRAIKYIRGKLC